jgi:hypothetical protein
LGTDTLNISPVTSPEDRGAGAEAWPPVAELILSAMDSGRHGSAAAAHEDKRAMPRLPFRVQGRLRLFSDGLGNEPRVVYTRDVNARGLGFITPHRLPLGYGGFIEFPGPDGRPRRLQCTLQRCREAAPGWYDAALCFNREQPELMEIHSEI